MQPKRLFILILALTIISAIIAMPAQVPVKINQGPLQFETTLYRPVIDFTLFNRRFTKDLELKQGLDLQGGTHVVLRADMENIDPPNRQNALDSAKNIISRRVDLYGIGEPVIQTSLVGEDYRIIVELPGVSDINQALDLIGRTAQLDFRTLAPEATEAADFSDYVSTGLTGKNLTLATVQYGQTGSPEVGIEFDSDGAELFSQITQANLGKPVAIFLDEFPVTIPTVNQHITGGSAVITGQFTLEQAKNLSIQLNAGALPVPIEVIEQKNIGASLGQDSVDKSLRAGLVGLTMVMLFMVLYYGWLGFLASIGLLIYALITLALYKLIPVTITLPGLAGFILSVGMAVDSNILVFERMKEELRSGKNWRTSMELGFGRAWDSIKDANVATLITAFILFNPFDWPFLNTSGMIRGFSLTLSLGILISLFTGIVVTRTLLRLFYRGEQ
jgi:preprotein translocase subunit SecD